MNEVNGGKNISEAKIKAVSQEERQQKWKKHFKNLLGNPPEITIHQTITVHREEFWHSTEKKNLKTVKLHVSMK